MVGEQVNPRIRALSIQPKIRTNFEGGPLSPVWLFRSVGPKYPFPFDKIVVPPTALFILLTRTITKRTVAWVGSVQSYCAVPLGSWKFCWMENALSIIIDNNNNNKTATTLTQISLITLMIIANRALWLARNARWLYYCRLEVFKMAARFFDVSESVLRFNYIGLGWFIIMDIFWRKK